MSRNPITGDELKSRVNNKAFEDGWDRIFGKKFKEEEKENNKIEDKDDK